MGKMLGCERFGQQERGIKWLDDLQVRVEDCARAQAAISIAIISSTSSDTRVSRGKDDGYTTHTELHDLGTLSLLVVG